MAVAVGEGLGSADGSGPPEAENSKATVVVLP